MTIPAYQMTERQRRQVLDAFAEPVVVVKNGLSADAVYQGRTGMVGGRDTVAVQNANLTMLVEDVARVDLAVNDFVTVRGCPRVIQGKEPGAETGWAIFTLSQE